MKKTLGGDRLGSGKNMKVDLHNYGRSTHDLGYVFRSTMSAGTLVPFICEVALPGDSFDINLNCDIKTHPTVGPLFGSYKVQMDIFQCPIRLYQGQLHNNKLGIGMKMNTVKLPIFEMTADRIQYPPSDMDNAQINPSSLLKYLGISGIGCADGNYDGVREFNGVPLLAYWDIYKNYYANKQEEIGAMVHTEPLNPDRNVDYITMNGIILPQGSPSVSIPLSLGTAIEVEKINTNPQDWSQVLVTIYSYTEQSNIVVPLNQLGILIQESGTSATFEYNYARYNVATANVWNWLNPNDSLNGEIGISTFSLSNIDDMREAILGHAPYSSPFNINGQNIEPYNLIFNRNPTTGYTSIMQSQEGLGLKTYQSDMFNNWLSTDWIDGTNGINEITSIDTSGGSFTIDTLNLAKKVYDMLNRIAVSGGTYDDWLDAVYTHDRYTKTESPMYMGGMIQELEFQEVVSNSESIGAGVNQPLGTLAGRGVIGKKRKGGGATIKVDEPSYIIGIISLTPRVDYSQGNKWDTNLKTMDDLHKPALDEIGFQELITEQMAWWETWETGDRIWSQKSAGKQPAWLNYMTNVNKVFGNFAIKSNEMFMTLNRRYEAEETVFPSGAIGAYKIGDLTTYVDPRKFNQIFAQTTLDSQNFWTQIGVNMNVRRKISARLMPNL